MKLEEGFFTFTPHNGPTRMHIIDELFRNNEFFRYIYQYHDQELDITIAPTASYPEKERMYRFYHKAVLSAAIKGLTEKGYELMDKIKADYILKSNCAVSTMINNGKEEPYLEDKAAMSKERLYRFISDCIHFIETELEEEVIGADEFKSMALHGERFKSLKNLK